VHEAIVAEKIQRAMIVIGAGLPPLGAGLPPLGAARSMISIGAERLVAREQKLQHVAADRRQPLRALRAQRFGMRQRVGGAALMIVVGGRGKRLRHASDISSDDQDRRGEV